MSTILKHRNSVVIDYTNGEAFLVRKGNDGGDVFSIDTVSGTPVVSISGNIAVTGLVDGRDIAADGSTIDALDAGGLSALTSGEIDQLENINTTTISATQWGYLGATDQALATTDAATFAGVTSEGVLTIDETNTEALLVRKNADGGDVFTIDTSGDIITANARYFSTDRINIEKTSTTAFSVATDSGVDTIFAVDTTNKTVSVATDATEAFLVSTNGDVDMFLVDTTNSEVEFGSTAITKINNTTAATSGSTGALQISGGISTNADSFFAAGLTVTGNLTVNGTTTTVDSETLTITDNFGEFNAGPAGSADAGILFKRYQTISDAGADGDVTGEAAEESSTAQAGGSATTIVLNGGANASDDYYNGWWIKITGGTANDNVRKIKDYVGSTKTATIYSAADETASAQTPPTGADFTASPDATSTYELYDCSYSSMFFDESAMEFAFACVPEDPNTVISPVKYASLHVKSITSEESMTVAGFTSDGQVIIDETNTEALLVRKDGDGGDVFVVDTTNSKVGINAAPLTSGALTIGYNTGANQLELGRADAAVGFYAKVLADNNVEISAPSGGSQLELRAGATVAMRPAGIDVAQFTANGLFLEGTHVIDDTDIEAFLVRKDGNSGDVFTVDTSGDIITANAQVIIDDTNTEAFLVRKDSDGGDILTVDTTNGGMTLNGNQVIDNTSTEAFLIRKDSDGGDIFTVDTTNSSIKATSSDLQFSGARTGDQSLCINQAAFTFTDDTTSASGTSATDRHTHSFAANTIAATNTTVTTTNAATLYIAGAPAAGTNQTITNPYALWVDAGNVKFDGDLTVDGAVTFGSSGMDSLIIDGTSTETFLVRKDADGGDIFTVDTTNSIVTSSKKLNVGDDTEKVGNSNVTTTDGTILCNGDLTLSSGVNPLVYFRRVGEAAPTFTNRSVGTKIVLRPDLNASSMDVAIGVETNSMWFSVQDTSASREFKWYGGTTEIMTLGGDGLLSLQGTQVIDNTNTEAFLVRKDADGGDVFTVDTTNERVLFGDLNFYNHFNGTDPLIAFDGADYILYDRSANQYQFKVASTDRLTINASTIVSEVKHIVDITDTEAFLVRKDADAGDVFTVDTSGDIITANAQVIIDDTNTEAFLVRKDADGGDIFTVDTTNSAVGVNTAPITAGALTLGYNSGGNQLELQRADAAVGGYFRLLADNNAELVASSGGATLDLRAAQVDITTGGVNAFTATSIGVTIGSNGVTTIGQTYSGSPTATGNFVRTGTSWTDDDTAASGTAAQDFISTFIRQPTIAADNATVTTTNASTLKVEGAPLAGTNQTITNAYALWVDSGNTLLDGDLTVGGSLIAASVTYESAIIDGTSTEALLVRKDADAGDVFTVDTTNSRVLFGDLNFYNNFDGTDPVIAFDTNDSIQFDRSANQYNFRVASSNKITINTSTIVSEVQHIVDSTGTEAFLVRKETDGGDVFVVDTTNEVIGMEARVSIFGSKSGTPSAAGSYLRVNNASSTFTDDNTAGSGTAAIMSFNSFGAPTLAATNTLVTTTDASTLYIAGAPIAGTNQTITNSYSLWVDSGDTKLDGTLIVNPTAGTPIAGAINAGYNSGNEQVTFQRADGAYSAFIAVAADNSISFRNVSGGADMSLQTNAVSNIRLLPGGTEVATFSSGGFTLNGNQVIDNTSTEAFLVRKDADGGDVFRVDTTNERTYFGTTFYAQKATDPQLVFAVSDYIQFDVSANQFNFSSDGTRFSISQTIATSEVDLLVDSTSTEAFLVRKDADGGDVFTVDTTNSRVLFGDLNFYNNFNGTDPVIAFDSNDSIQFDRSANQYNFRVASSNKITINTNTIVSEVQHIVDSTSTEAFLVRKETDGGDVFTVDTTNSTVSINGIDITPSTGVLNETSFAAANNVVAAANVTGFAFAEADVRSFRALVSVSIDATADLYEQFELRGLQKATGTWVLSANSIGDESNVTFSIASSGGNGQIQYTSGNEAGFVSSTIKFLSIQVTTV